MVQVLTRATKQQARYTPAGGRERCADCRFFVSPNDCKRIIGPVSPRGWCKYFSQEAVAASRRPSGFLGGGGGGGAGIGDTSLDLNFLNTAALDPRITLVRASTATYFDTTGAMQTAAANVARFDYNPSTHASLGLLIEEFRTNLLLNSATLGTQSVAVTAQAYTLSFYGTGTITKSGTASGALVGSGAFPARVSQTFTPTAGTLTLTVTGSVLNAQLEAGGFATSYIPTTAAAASRQTDSVSMALGAWYGTGTIGSVVVELTTEGTTPNGGIWGNWSNGNPILDNADGGVGNLPSGGFYALGYAGIGNRNLVPLSPEKIGWAYSNGAQAIAIGGTLSPASLAATPTVPASVFIGDNAGQITNGWYRRVRYWPRMLSNGELSQATT